jgi:hypothetical protein
MRLAYHLLLPVAALVVTAAPTFAQAKGDDHAKFTTRETAVWESVKNKEVESLRKVMSDDYTATYDAGTMGVDDELKGIGQTELHSYKLDDVKVHRIDPANVIVTAKVAVDANMAGKNTSGTYNTMTVWHRVGNAWRIAAHTEVKMP